MNLLKTISAIEYSQLLRIARLYQRKALDQRNIKLVQSWVRSDAAKIIIEDILINGYEKATIPETKYFFEHTIEFNKRNPYV